MRASKLRKKPARKAKKRFAGRDLSPDGGRRRSAMGENARVPGRSSDGAGQTFSFDGDFYRTFSRRGFLFLKNFIFFREQIIFSGV